MIEVYPEFSTAGSGLQPELSGLLNTDVCANYVISKDINTVVQVANLNPQKGDARCVEM